MTPPAPATEPSRAAGRLAPPQKIESLGDFHVPPRVALIALLALPVGGVAALVAVALLKLIALFTNLCFHGQFSFGATTPGSTSHWWLILFMPIAGGLVIGVMARYGSEKIRGHGMPEAIESILVGGSRVQPRVAVLKPVSSAVSIGTGGPFGAEGPIIMTGGAVGSILAQFLHVTTDERKTLLVAGSAAGMAATFNSPLAAILLAVELLLFEWRPRSYIPVAVAAVTATLVREPILGSAPSSAGPMSQPDCRSPRTASAWSPDSAPDSSHWAPPPSCTSRRTCSPNCRCTGCGGPPSAASSSAPAA